MPRRGTASYVPNAAFRTTWFIRGSLYDIVEEGGGTR